MTTSRRQKILPQVLREEGVRGIYRGYLATLASFGPFSGTPPRLQPSPPRLSASPAAALWRCVRGRLFVSLPARARFSPNSSPWVLSRFAGCRARRERVQDRVKHASFVAPLCRPVLSFLRGNQAHACRLDPHRARQRRLARRARGVRGRRRRRRDRGFLDKRPRHGQATPPGASRAASCGTRGGVGC